jgi:hypothetical protein
MQIGTVKIPDFVGGTIGCLPTEQAAKASAGVLLGQLFNGMLHTSSADVACLFRGHDSANHSRGSANLR